MFELSGCIHPRMWGSASREAPLRGDAALPKPGEPALKRWAIPSVKQGEAHHPTASQAVVKLLPLPPGLVMRLPDHTLREHVHANGAPLMATNWK